MSPHRWICISLPRRWSVQWHIWRCPPADALRNLIENALAHTPPESEVVVEVSPDGAISVQDSGLGIPVEDRPHIFERFWRGKGVRADGAGLGLAIVMEIVRAHGATITVSERVPRGARFDLRFRTA